MALLRRSLRRLAQALLVLVAAAALALGGLALALATDAGRRVAADWAGMLLSDAHQTVRIGEIGPGLPGELRLGNVEVGDAKGVWLAVDALDLRWHPASLLHGRLAVEQLQVGEIQLTRLPEAPPATGQAFTLPRFALPLDVEIVGFRLQDLSLGAAVAGADVRLGAEGSVLAEARGQIRSRLRLRRLDSTPAEASFDLAYDPAAATLALRAHVEEAAGGLLPTLLRTPKQAFSLELEGSGGFDAWRGHVESRLGGEPLLSADVTSTATAGLKVSADGRMHLARYLPELGSAPLRVTVTLAEIGNRRWRVETGRLALPWAVADVGGEMELTERPRLALTYAVKTPQGTAPPGLPAGTRLEGLTANGRLDGTLEAPKAAFSIGADRIALRDAEMRRIAIKGRIDSAAEPLAAHLALDADALAYAGATLRNLKGEAEVSGTLAAPLIDFTANVATVQRTGAEATGIAASGRISGPLGSPAASVRLNVAEARQDGTDARRLRLAGELAPDGGLQVEGDAAEVAIQDDPLPTLAKAPLKVVAEGRLDTGTGRVEARTLRLSLPTLSVSGSGGLAFDSGDVDFAGEARLADISPFGQPADLPLSGATDLHLALRRSGADGTVSGTLAGRLRGLDLHRPELTALLGTEPGYATDWRLERDGRLTLWALALDAKAATLHGGLTLAPGAEQLEAQLRADVPDIAALTPVLGIAGTGRARLDATLAGSPDAPDAKLDLRIDDAAIEGYALGAVTGRAEVGGPWQALAGNLRLELAPKPGPLVLSARFQRQDERLLLDDLALRGTGLNGTGSLAVDTVTTRASGSLKLDAAELSGWAGLAGLQASGGLRAAVTLDQHAGAQAVAAKLQFSDFSIAPSGGTSLAGESLELSLATAWPADTADGRLDIDARGLAYREATLSRLALHASGTPEAADVTVEATGQWREPVTLNAAGRMTRANEAITLELARLQATGFDLNLALSHPTRLTIGPDRIEVAGLAARVGEGQITAEGQIDRQSIGLTAEGRALPLSPLASLGVSASGNASFRLRLQGDWPNPTGDAEIEVADLQLTDAGDLPPVAARMTAQWRDGRLAFDGTVDAGAETPLRLEGALPLSAHTAPLAVSIAPAAPLSARLYWSGEVGQLWSLVPLPEHRLKGLLTADLRLSGTAAAPVAAGQVTLTGGEYEHLRFGTQLRKLELSLVADGTRRLRLDRLTASDGKGGRLSGTGELRFDELWAPSFDAKLELHDFLALRRDDVTASVDAELTLDGNMSRAAAKGVITTRQIEARVDNTLSSDVVKLDVIEVGGGHGRQPVEPTPRTRHLAVLLDLLVRVPGQAFLRGRGLDSEWAGELNIGGSTVEPKITGKLHSVRGSFAVLGKTFKLQDSDIAVALHEGAPDALLNISAINSSSDLDVIVKVGGWASAPELSWSSVPALPQDEILSRLLFNKGTGQLTAFEAVQLAAAAAELSGHGGGSIVDTLRSAIGVDSLRLSSEGEGGPKVEAGKYLSDEVFIGVSQGAETGSSGGLIELQVLPNVSIESEVEATGGANVGVKFKWDY